MKVILIEEERFREIRRAMEFACEKVAGNPDSCIDNGFKPSEIWKMAVHETHRTVNMEFVRWAQSHGASCIK